MAFSNRTTLTPILLTYKNDSMYLHIDPQGCALFSEDSLEPLYRTQEPILLAQGIMTDFKTAHLVVLKTNGDLCYTLISGSGTPQTSLLARLDVRATKYRRLFLFPKGKQIHIFYAYSNQAISDLWHIEHRFWDGTSWRSVHMGEVIHPREPLYHVDLDSQGNIHFLTMTFQGRHSLLFTNRFNGTFHIWGSPTEALKISGEVVDIAALMTSDNVHHLFWALKTSTGQFELRWAQQANAHEFSSTWQPSPAPIKTFSSLCKSIGSLEMNGVLWLLARTGEEVLMLNDGKGWKSISSHTSSNRPLQWVHKGEKNFYQTNWLADQFMKRAPAYHQELGLTIKKQAPPLPAASYFQAIPTQVIPPTPPPVPAFYPELSPNTDPLPQASSTPPRIEVLETSGISEEIIQPLSPKENPELQSLILTVANLEQENAKLQSLATSVALLEQENAKLQSLISAVTRLEHENTTLSFSVHEVLSKFDQILDVLTEKDRLSEQEVILLEESREAQTALAPLAELEPFKEAVSNLEQETQSLSQVLRVMLTKQEESDSSIDKLELQICQLKEEKEDVKIKGGFWNKWIT